MVSKRTTRRPRRGSIRHRGGCGPLTGLKIPPPRPSPPAEVRILRDGDTVERAFRKGLKISTPLGAPAEVRTQHDGDSG